LREQADFVRRRHDQPDAGRSRGKLPGGCGHFRERFREIARDPETERHGKQKGDAEGRQQSPAGYVRTRSSIEVSGRPSLMTGNAGVSLRGVCQQTRDVISALAGCLAGSDIHASSRGQRVRDLRAGQVVVYV
jgi:hypothetical protein